MDVTIHIPDGVAPEYINMRCGKDDRMYNAHKLDGEGRGAFAKRMLLKQEAEALRDHRITEYNNGTDEAEETARLTYQAANEEPELVDFS